MEFSFPLQSLQPLSHTIPTVSTEWSHKDYWGTIKVRWGIGRDHYAVTPGLYKIGNPDRESDVMVSANYKLSFDILRRSLKGLNVWVLVIDTKGVNVWCAAGKNTFSTNNIVESIKKTSLELIVKHRKIIVPQLGAPGVAAHIVNEQTGFRVIYGPIRANDIPAFIEAGYKASPEMRSMIFPAKERAKLIPVDFMYGKYKLVIIICLFFLLSGLNKQGISFSKMISTGLFPTVNLLAAYIAGVIFGPLFLPYIPFRAFSLKGACWGLLASLLLYPVFHVSILETLGMIAINTSIASFVTMNFTGSSTFTSLSGVRKEMKWSVPFQLAFAFSGLSLFIISKFI